MQRWPVAIGTFLLGLALLLLAVPRLVAGLLLLPGNNAVAATESGRALSGSGYERAIRSREDALRWAELPRARIELGGIRYVMAQHAEGRTFDLDDLLRRGRDAFEQGLAGQPLDGYSWARLADLHRAQGNLPAAAGALRLSLESAPYEVTLRPLQGRLSLLLWPQLDPETRRKAGAAIGTVLASPSWLAFLRYAQRHGRLPVLHTAVAGDSVAAVNLWQLLKRQDELPGEAATALSLDDYTHMLPTLSDSLDVEAYFTGVRDALYEANAVLRTTGVEVFCPAPGAPPVGAEDLARLTEAVVGDSAAVLPQAGLTVAALQALVRRHACAGQPGAP